MSKSRHSITVYDVLWTAISITSIVGLIALGCGIFRAHGVLAIGVVLTGLLFFFGRKQFGIQSPLKSLDAWLIFILLIGGVFRFNPFFHVYGGQDQGLYVNMAPDFDRNGGFYFKNELREKARAAGWLAYYDDNNLMSTGVAVAGEYEGTHLPGLYNKDLKHSVDVYQFYPGHPLWMSLIGSVIGFENEVWSVVFFSFLILISSYLLVYEISKNRTSALIATSFFALSPLYAFMAKFPVSETPTVAFLLAICFYLYRAWNLAGSSANGRLVTFYQTLAVLISASYFATRISGFITLPLAFTGLISCQVFLDNTDPRRRSFSACFAAFIVLFCACALYGFRFSFPYSFDIYRMTFLSLLGENWFYVLPSLIVGGLAVCIVAGTQRLKSFSKRALTLGFRLLPYFATLLIIDGLYILAFSNHYREDRSLSPYWEAADLHKGAIFKSSALWVYLVYITPPLFVYFFARLFKRVRKFAIPENALLILLCLGLYYTLTKAIYIGYQYYYARYLMVEMLPASFFLSALYLGHDLHFGSKVNRGLAISLIAFMSLHSLYYSSFQLQGGEFAGIKSGMHEITNTVRPTDLLMFDQRRFALITGLDRFYNLDVLIIEKVDDISTVLKSWLSTLTTDAYILAAHPIDRPGVRLVKELELTAGAFEHSRAIPIHYEVGSEHFYLYKLIK